VASENALLTKPSLSHLHRLLSFDFTAPKVNTLLAICQRNLPNGEQRKAASWVTEPLEEDFCASDETLSFRDIEAIACERDWQHRVKVAVQKLPEHLRLPLVLRFWDELSYPEIAQILGIKESTARMRVFAALKMLAAMLGLSLDRRREG
jgi:RNA polymerase sigma factor (sigma-70 family)